MTIQPTYLSPLPQGKSLRIAKESVVGAGAKAWTSQTESDAVLVSLFVDSVAGNLTVEVFTQTDEGRDLLVAALPVVSAPTTNLLIKKAATIINQIKVVATWTGPVSYELYLRGVSGADTGVKVLGATDAQVKQQNVGPTTTLLIPAALVDRTGLVVKNNNTIGGALVYFGFTVLEATVAAGYPLGAQESIGMDLASGVEIYAISTSGTADMRIIESGG